MNSNTEFVPKGSMTMLNQSGDVTIIWSEEHASKMHELIEKKIKEGYQFFILESKLFGLYNSKEKVVSVDQIKMGSKLLLCVEDALKLFSEGTVKVSKRSKKNNEVTHRSDDVDSLEYINTLKNKRYKKREECSGVIIASNGILSVA